MNWFPERTAGVLLLAAVSVTAGGETRLTEDGRLKSSPLFLGPAGDEVVYVEEDRPNRMRLMRLRLPAGKPEPLHPDETRSEFEPAASADGKVLAFAQNRGNLSIALVISDLAAGKDAEVKPAGGFSGPRSPTVRPDGTRVLFAFADGGKQQIVSVDRIGGNRKTVVDSPGLNNFPHFSPDGKQLTFASTRDGNFEVYTADADGSHPRRLTDHPRQDIRPRWSPDGKRLAFTSNRDGNYEVYVMDADGSGLQRVTDRPERDDYPEWHPDGKRLLVVSERDGKHDLYLVDLP